uniref:Uncharacterized protein n=1 Tax=Pyramimonas obovata TaxID=1411642 RepID=A0A7S0WGE0_9CHLO|mmetsp:Transcript_25091/g.54583  ORF Transcript_25091/g.54583 Transcript_25091/m.54583 type:complete len:342 (+) Transcript_25091:93-1118(+)|eukprot:CAMPEP_0118947740 /NCGR_PEP_ID=MMETSP1169-20130426/46586_1 /TAXON_ID=36882 /ORGANISM="Pyramimonas obovata, Strain CCMP722" /LENGTH=341 /DNA_ID=CAMNT_0006894011 /DNA_START=86 /DNA_END=1111 /DNA_ORIENTATION=-
MAYTYRNSHTCSRLLSLESTRVLTQEGSFRTVASRSSSAKRLTKRISCRVSTNIQGTPSAYTSTSVASSSLWNVGCGSVRLHLREVRTSAAATETAGGDEGEESSGWQTLIDRLLEQGIDGTGVTESSKALAEAYELDSRYETIEERVNALMRLESAKSFLAGFVSGVGGVWTLPVAVPATVYANWMLQARLAGAIAYLYGHDISSKRVRSLILLCLLGDGAWGVLKSVGVRAAEATTSRAIQRIPVAALAKLNQAVGTKLVVKCGEKGAIKLQRAIPIVGGMVAGGFDAGACMVVGKVAIKMFQPFERDPLGQTRLAWDGTIDVGGSDYTVGDAVDMKDV